jgi:penicillin-binding protein 2
LNREDILNKIADILNKDRDEFRKFIFDEVKKNSIFFVDSDLDKEEVLKIKTLNLKGFYLILSNKRQYIDGPQFSQIIGYVGKVSKKELDADSYYYPTDTIGRLGIESWYEKYLRGTHGEIFFQSDKDYLIKDPEIGNSIILNIDYNIQKALFNELFNILKESGHSKAAAIVQNPQTGEVLAMVSFPTYDNNLFIEGLSEIQFKNLFENKLKPIFNRVISGLYNPGSTIKPLMGLMTLQENIFNPTDTIRDCVNLVIKNQNNPDNFYTFNNWRPEYGLFNLKRSIANSCNIYFFIAGGGYGNIKGLGIEKIANYLKSLFVDTKLGIDLPGESSGLIPTPEWKLKNRNEPWYQGDTYNVSIGQGDLLVTPLWLNSYISAIANGGIFYKPFIVKQVLNKNKEVLKTFDSEILGHLNFRDEFIKEVRDAMLETTLTGTAKLLGTLPVKVGAKTGTAEVIKGRSVNSIITAFAPFENPEINITVLIEGEASINQGLALRTAYGFLKWYFEEYSNYNRSE